MIRKFKQYEGFKNPFKKTIKPTSDNPNDPFGEEEWDEDYDIEIDKLGFTAQHYKGGDVGHWKYHLNIEEYWKYVKEKNPQYDAQNKQFLCGLVAGLTMADEYHEKMKNQ